MRTTPRCRPILATADTSSPSGHRLLGFKSIGAQVLITGVLGAIAMGFGAGVANAAHGAATPVPARPHAPAAASARWTRVGPWPGDPFGPYGAVPAPTESPEEQPASNDDATWRPTGASWPPGGGGGDSSGSATPIVMPRG
jgi:hypothetical protein